MSEGPIPLALARAETRPVRLSQAQIHGEGAIPHRLYGRHRAGASGTARWLRGRAGGFRCQGKTRWLTATHRLSKEKVFVSFPASRGNLSVGAGGLSCSLGSKRKRGILLILKEGSREQASDEVQEGRSTREIGATRRVEEIEGPGCPKSFVESPRRIIAPTGFRKENDSRPDTS